MCPVRRHQKTRPLGKLYVCATPIGNLEDVTYRVVRILKSADLVAAEDTRTTQKLFARYGITSPVTSYHEHNEKAKAEKLLQKLGGGKTIALVSEAGMPGISDPGHRLVKRCIEEGIALEVLPGPSAVVSALVISGLPSHQFTFLGFLPRRQGERRRLLNATKDEPRTLVFYESPRRLPAALADILRELGDRRIAVVRELTKKFEQVLRGTVSSLIEELGGTVIRGELVLVLQGSLEQPQPKAELLRAQVLAYMEKGISKRDAIGKTATLYKISKRAVYDAAVEIPAIEN